MKSLLLQRRLDLSSWSKNEHVLLKSEDSGHQSWLFYFCWRDKRAAGSSDPFFPIKKCNLLIKQLERTVYMEVLYVGERDRLIL